MKIASLNLYPVKSLAGVSPPAMWLDPWGPDGDRRWMIVDPEGRFITQRTTPHMATIHAVWQHNRLTLCDALSQVIRIDLPHHDTLSSVKVWRSEVEAYDAGEEAAAWLTKRLKRPCRLVYMRHPERARKQWYNDQGYVTSFADGFPLLICTEASLEDLNRRLDVSIPMTRFRPNIVVTETDAWAEDHWSRLAIGDVIVRIVKPCSRCVVTTVDQQTGEIPQVGSPLKTLATFRRQKEGIIFGQNALVEQSGRMAVGDNVHILE